MRDPRYDPLFEPLTIGPVVAKNRFYQAPHCSGMGWTRPQALAAMRATKAEGGWGVVCTEYCSAHPSSDDGGYPFATIWDDGDVRAHARMTEAVHAHGALAGVELWMGGAFVGNLVSRTPTIGVSSLRGVGETNHFPHQSRRADLSDIRAFRRWQGDAARRAVAAGFDIVYVYATHGYLLSEFLDAATNDRTDAYGGSLENRVRLVRELIEETREAVGDRAAVAVRFSVTLEDPESYDAFGLLAEAADLWDLTVDDYDIEMGVSRFVKEGALAPSVRAAKALTTRPVVAVGRYTSPDSMVRALRDGAQDLIGAARPSIADPFLPKKIEEGRLDDIRECIGCNICYAHNSLGAPIRCTQNPTMGEEWRRGWRPEDPGRASAPGHVLIVGAGPAGLEAARVAGARGWRVTLAEATRRLGGRVTRESALPGLAEWARVRDWRLGQLEKTPKIEIYRESRLTAAEARAVGADRILVATGARWTTDGVSRASPRPIAIAPRAQVISADDALDAVSSGAPIAGGFQGRALIYDDENYYLAGALALALRRQGADVIIATPAARVGAWSAYTNELWPATAALIEAQVARATDVTVKAFDGATATLACLFTGRERPAPADALLPLTRREPVDALYRALIAEPGALADAGVASARRIGDCEAPSIIASAVYSGCAAAMTLGEAVDEDAIHGRRERPAPA